MGTNGSIDRERLRRYRLSRVREVMKRLNLDAVVAATFDNVRYISDSRLYYTPVYYVNAYVAVLPNGGDPIVQGPVVEGAPMGLAPEVKGWSGYPMIPIPAIAKKWAGMVSNILSDNSVHNGRIGFDDMSFLSYAGLSSLLPKMEAVPVFESMLDARAIKSPDEIALIRKAAEIVDIAAEAGLATIKPGVTEREVVAKLSAALYEAGSEAEPWPSVFASGERSLTSLFASDRVLKDGDIGVFDVGSIFEGYLGDIARTGAAGAPSRQAREIYTAAFESLEQATRAVRPGRYASEADAKIRDSLRAGGFDVPPLSTGHGIGVGAPELPWVTPREEGITDYKLEPNMVVCLEPRTSKWSLTSAGCEDMVLVTDAGHEVLTHCPKQEHLLIR